MVQKSGTGQVGSLPAFSEQRNRSKKTFPMKTLDLPGLNFAHLYLGVDNGEITAECSRGCWVGKAVAEEVMASPLPLRAEKLTPNSH